MLKSKLTKWAIVFAGIFFATGAFAQRDLVISGGNTVSSFVCENKTAFVWGSNSAGQLGLHDAGGALITTDPITTPTAITKFNGVASAPDVKQINSGSGSHFVVLACTGDVWAWGVNGSGQIGNNTSGGVVTIPTRVIASTSVAAANRGAGNVLINAAVVYSGTVNSFAILNDGKMVSWGANSGAQAGQLGNGTTTDASIANYVLTGPGTPLTGVTQIFAGDNVAYALVDPDGDGVGTVYSWGNGLNGTLGRDAAGTSNPASGATVQDSYARPVYYATGGQMNNITQLQAGDVFGIALDVNGYVWSWGNGGWNNSTGNTTINYTGSDPRKVIAGTTTGASNDGTYLLAKAIGGGQGYGMAVTVDGKPVAWGGTGMCTNGGMTGTGATNATAGIPPSYIQYAPGQVHNNVTLINRGDTWGFYGTANNDLYAWGCNNFGQLGIGSTVDQAYATKITPPTGCSLRDPVPTASLSYANSNVCPTFSMVLNSGFVPNTGLGASYQVTWYKGSVAPANIVQQGLASIASNLTYTATAVDKYIVVVSYVGTNAGCSVYPDAQDDMTFTQIMPPYTANTGTYCSGNATFSVTGTGSYNWYNVQTAGTKLNTTTTSSFTTAISNAEVVDATHIRLWVDDISSYSGAAVPTAPCAPPTHENPNRTYQKFTISTAGTLESIQVQLYNNNNATGSVNLSATIYADAAGAPGAAVFTSLNTSIPVPVNNTYGIAKAIAINYAIAPGTYWLQVNSPSSEVAVYSCYTYPAVENSGKAALTITNGRHDSGLNTNSGTAFNWRISNNYYPCGRVPVVLSKVCPPCSKPTAVTITVPAATPTTICEGTAQTLTGSSTVPAAPQNTNFTYSWIKTVGTGSGVLVAPTALTNPGSYPGTIAIPSYAGITGLIADAGTYVLRVEDGNTGNSSCYTEATVVINVSPTPTITGTLNVCEGLTTTLTGSGTPHATTPWTSATTSVATVSNTGVVTGVLAGTSVITYKTSAGCTQTATVTVNANPTITGTLSVCAGSTTTLTGSGTPDATTPWSSATTSVATVSNTGVVTGVSAGTSVITYKTSSGCIKTATVTVNAVPTITGTLNVCVGLT
ncbi:MAG: gliding motility-associated C-terminal domain-containing protein, partial [Cytophaga sp.]